MPIKINGANTGSVTIAAPDDGDSVTFDVINDTPITNECINGTFSIWQRATSQTVTGIDSDDRFGNVHGESTKTHSRQAFTAGQTDVPNSPTYYSRTVVTTADTASCYTVKYQSLIDVRKFAGKRVAIKFHGKADATKNIAIEGRQNFGSGGSSIIYGIDPQKVGLTTGWTKNVVYIDFPSVTGKTIGDYSYSQILFHFDGGSNYDSYTDTLGTQSGTFELSEIEIYVSDIERTCIRRSEHEELIKCLSYALVIEDTGVDLPGLFNSNDIFYGNLSLSVPLIRTPSITATLSDFRVRSAGSSNITPTGASVGTLSPNHLAILFDAVGGDSYQAGVAINLGPNSLIINAEL